MCDSTPESTPSDAVRPAFDIGEIFRVHGPDYERSHDMPSQQRKALRAIASCRTSALGGHLDRCPECGFEQPAYNSCRNANCPKCQGAKRLQWVAARLEELLDCPYYHCVFTIPDTFNDLHVRHYRELHSALFRAASRTLLAFFRDIGGVPAMTAVLHTWGQTLCLHPHVHILVTGGCLSFDRGRWIATGSDRLFDVYALSRAFKQRFLNEIAKRIPHFTVPDETIGKDWVVHCTKPFAGAAKVVEYLGRYTYRAAISNHRILDFADGEVMFDYKDYADTDEAGTPCHKRMTLDADEFMRRFLQHIPPANFRRIRFYGILGGADRAAKLERAAELLATEPEVAETTHETVAPCLDISVETQILCPQCQTAFLESITSLPPTGPPPITFRNERRRPAHAA